MTYDVIVLDLSLGGREGISLLRLIAANPGDPVVIFITRLDDRVRAASIRFATALGLRVAGALAKPVGLAALRALLDNPPPPRADQPRHAAFRQRPRSWRRHWTSIGSSPPSSPRSR